MWHLRQRTGLPLDCKLYGLRHRFCTAGVKAGVQMKTVAELMGHASLYMTEYYAHLAGDTDHLVEAAEQTNKLLKNGTQSWSRHSGDAEKGGNDGPVS